VHRTKVTARQTQIGGRSGRRMARATLGGGFPVRTLSVCTTGSQFPIVHVSIQPPSHPGRSDFPSPVGGDSCFPRGTCPYRRRLKHSLAYPPLPYGYILSSTFAYQHSLCGTVSTHAARLMPSAHREPLCTVTVLPRRPQAHGLGRLELPRLHRSYWLMRQTVILPLASVSLFQRVFAGCCEPLLHDGPSRRYLCYLPVGAWTPTPAALQVLLPVSSPKALAFPAVIPGRRLAKTPHSDFRADRLLEAAVIPLRSGPHVCSPS